MSTFNLTDQTNLFKINYFKKSENMYNSYNVLQGRIKKRYDFTGKQRFVATPLSFSGGVGSGSLPTSNAATYEGAILTAKKVYATCAVDRESIKASANDQGAFVRATKEVVQKTVESYMRNASRILFGDGTGALGTGDGSTIVTGNGSTSPYSVVISAATWNESNWEEKDFVNYSSETTNLEVVSVTPSTRTIELVGTSAGLADAVSGTSSISGVFYMQGSKDNDPYGLKSIADATLGSTSLYNITAQRKWSMNVTDANGAGINPDRMNNMMLEIERRFGKAPTMIVTSYTQMRKVLDFLEDQKVYHLPAKSADLKGVISFKGVEFMSTRGPIGLFADRFCDVDRMYFLNENFIEVHHRPAFGWFDDDGTVFLRGANTDDYSARYGGYYQNYITPTAHGCLKGLAI